MQKEGDSDFLLCSSTWTEAYQLPWVVDSWNSLFYVDTLIFQIVYENLGQVGVQRSSCFIPRSWF